MKHKILIINTFVGIFMAANAFAYDGTGMWNFTEYGAYNNCVGYSYVPESGEIGLLQTGSTFLIVGEDYSAEGAANGNIYSYSDTWCQFSGIIISNAIIRLTSEIQGTGTVSWTYSEQDYSCSGGHQFTVTKQTQTAPVYDATGKWDFTQSGFSLNCGTTPPTSGYLEVIQTGNKITVVDNLDNQYNGFVNGAHYAMVRSYPYNGGRTTEWGTITLSSETQGSGESRFVWDDDCGECWGDWNISMTKDVTPSSYTITATAAAGGTISPSGVVTVDAGASQGFQISAASGYVISEVIVDDLSAGALSSYTFNDVSEEHTIYAIFELDIGACESLIMQNFNEGLVPPRGWQLLTTNQNYTWKPLLISTGDYAAAVDWDDEYQQDEVLLSQQLSIKEAILHFWSTGDIVWCRDTFNNCDLEIWIVVGTWDGGSVDDIFIGKADDDWIENYYLAASSFNLTSILPDKPIRIGFRYKGIDGNLIVLDDVQICSDKPSATYLPFLLLLLE